jgi:pimeloyl-ACP methyl ester carboxylesterase
MIRIVKFLILYLFATPGVFSQIQSEEISLQNKEIQLLGTLTYSQENTPLIVWVHGSGPVDRNGNQLAQNVNANYIKQFRNAVNKENIAFFSYDKRTANKENRAFLKDTKVIDFAMDAQVVIRHFKNKKQFSKIVLIGHSQGSLVGMLASKNIDKYISIAGAGKTIDNIMVQQISKNNPTLGAAAKQQFDTLRMKGKIEVIHPFLISIFAKPMQSFWLSWMMLDPLEEIKKLSMPVLIINGDKDLQVEIENAEALHAVCLKSELVLIKNMNHVLKDIQKDEDNLFSYYKGTFQISEKLIETIVSFVKK